HAWPGGAKAGTTITGLCAWPGGARAGTTITGLRAWPERAIAGTTITGLRAWPREARAGTTLTYSEHSSVTYTSVPSPVKDYSDIRSPEVDGPPSPDYVPGPKEPEQPPLSLDYVPGPKEPEQAPLLSDYVPGPKEPEQAPPSPVYLPYVPEVVYPEYMPPEDDVFPAEEQPFPVVATPTADSPGYIFESGPKGDREEDDEEDPEEDPADYPAEGVTKPLLQISSPPLPIPSPPPDSPTHIEIPESCLPLRKRLRFASHTPSQEVGKSSAAGAARQDEPVVAMDDPYSLVREELYGFIDRRLPSFMIEREARMAREAWGLSMDASDNAHSDVMSLRTTLVAQHALILDLQAADRRRQGVIKELLAADHKRQPDAPGEAGSSS
nr:hypothetical protein [Tanacetum cinerariifolium]